MKRRTLENRLMTGEKESETEILMRHARKES
jgi:hypothetical protein